MSDRVLRPPRTPAPEWRQAVASAFLGLARQAGVGKPAKRQSRPGGLDQVPPCDTAGRRSGGPQPRPGGMLGRLQALWRRHRSRQRISLLDARTLRDIGVTFAEAEAEANKPFWRG